MTRVNPAPKIHRLPMPLRLGMMGFMVVLTLGAALAPFLQIPAVKDLDTFFYDRFMTHARSGAPYSHAVTIVDIDETSLAGAGQWPWPRYRLAQMLAILSAHSPRAIGLDVVFPEPDRLSLSHLVRQFKTDFRLDLEFSNVPTSLTDNDGFFGYTLGQTRAVGARYYYFDHISRNEICKSFPFEVRFDFPAPEQQMDLPQATGVLCNTPKIETRLASAGFINNQYDRDGLLRRTPMLIQYRDGIAPHLSLALFMMENNINTLEIGKGPGGFSLRAGPANIPITREGFVNINFNGPARSFKYISALDILNQAFDPADIRGKTILVGSSAVGLNDIHPTVFDPHFPGIEVSAVLLDNMSNRGFIRVPSWSPVCLALVSALFGGVLIFMFTRNPGPMALSLATLGLAGAVFTASLVLYRQWAVFVPPSLPLVLGLVLFILITLIRFAAEKQLAYTWLRRLAAAQQLTMEIMVSMVETRDPETGEHIIRTQHYARAVALQLRKIGQFTDLLTDEYIETLFLSVPLHDIGKVGIPDNILLKPARLSDDEYRHMKMHATYGRIILRRASEKIEGSNYLAMGEDIAGTHHERWDGRGYPEGLAGEEIPLSGRIMAVADVYDALISKRCYKPPFPHEKAMAIILEEKGKIFDPVVVDAFTDIEATIKEIAQKFGEEE